MLFRSGTGLFFGLGDLGKSFFSVGSRSRGLSFSNSRDGAFSWIKVLLFTFCTRRQERARR